MPVAAWGKSIAQALGHTGLEAGEARPLLQAALGVDRAFLAAHDDERLSPGQAVAYSAFVERRKTGEPMAYILGEREFYGLNFKVTPAVLIPRPETELLVELALLRIPKNKSCRVLDLGTGCGNIAVALAHYRPLAQITAVDSSAAALEVAEQNAQNLLGEANSIRFQQSDWFTALSDEKFDLIVSNPPYVAASDPHLQQGDLRFEPRQALRAGGGGLKCIEHIAGSAPRHLHGGGSLLFEHGYDQAGAGRRLLAVNGFSNLFSATDLAGISRVCGGQRA